MDCEIQEYWEGTECASWEYTKEGMSHVTSSHSERGRRPDWARLQLLKFMYQAFIPGLNE